MLTEFFLENARIELAADATRYRGYVPELPEIHVEGLTPEECRARLAAAITEVLSRESDPGATTVNARVSQEFDPGRPADRNPVQDSGVDSITRRFIESADRTQSSEESLMADFTFREIIYEKRDGVARVTINRPEAYNAYSDKTLREMTEAFKDAAQDDSIAVLVLSGVGDRAFCVGSDVKQHSEQHLGRPHEFREWIEILIEAHESLRNLGKPSVARINGIVAGGGNEWNLACDLAIASDHAKFMQVETSVGMVAASGAPQWLPLIIGDRRAREMMLTCEPISANKALLWGLVNDVVPYKELDKAVDALCQKIIDKFPECTRYTRQQLNFWKDLAWNTTVQQTREWLSLHFSGPEAKEGLTALAERREIDYRGFRDRAERANHASDRQNRRREIDPHSADERACSYCGSTLPANFEYCGMCGAKLPPARD